VSQPPLTGERAAEIAADAAFRAKVAALYRCGPRPVAESLAEIAAERVLATYIDEKLGRYLALDGAALDVLNACVMPPAPLHKVQK
jgi:hypothetical protein